MVRTALAFLFSFSIAAISFAQTTQPSLNVRKYGATGNGKTDDTAAIQKALDACADGGGGTVRIPAGDYLTGSIALKSNTTLQLDADATLVGTDDLNEYPIVKARWEGRWVDAYRALVSAQDAEHIAIVGSGSIVGNPTLGGRQMPRRPCVVETIHCNDVRFEGFSASQRLMWTIHPTECDNVSASNLTIRGIGGNSDGIDVDSCRHVKIDRCDILTGDDCIALKSGRGMEGFTEAKPTEDVLITNCTLADTIFACIGIGSETSGGIRGVKIEHCNFARSVSYAIYIKSRTDRGAFIDDISGSDLDVQNAVGFLRINLTSSGIADTRPVTGDEGIPSSKNYHFSNVTVKNVGILVDATQVSPKKPLDGLKLSNITGQCYQGMRLVNIVHADLSGIDVTGFEEPKLAISNVTGTGLDGAVAYSASTQP